MLMLEFLSRDADVIGRVLSGFWTLKISLDVTRANSSLQNK